MADNRVVEELMGMVDDYRFSIDSQLRAALESRLRELFSGEPLSVEDVHARIREAGGIVHRDGNIFFTNAERFIVAAVLCGERPPRDEAAVAAIGAVKDSLTAGVLPSSNDQKGGA